MCVCEGAVGSLCAVLDPENSSASSTDEVLRRVLLQGDLSPWSLRLGRRRSEIMAVVDHVSGVLEKVSSCHLSCPLARALSLSLAR